jgi:hypothetical protein
LLPDASLAQSMMDNSLRIAELQEQHDELKRLRNVVVRSMKS